MVSSNSKRRQLIALAVFSILLFPGYIWSITSGEYNIPIERFFKTLAGQGDAIDGLILLNFRLPRMIIIILVGAALSISGAAVQSVTENPIAESGILGINVGGGLAIVLSIATSKINADNFVYVLPLISILGGIATALTISILSFSKNEGTAPASAVLIDIGSQTALYGGSITIMSRFDDKQSDSIAAWSVGSIWGDKWPFVVVFLPQVLIIVPYLLFKLNMPNITHTGDNIARGLGVRSSREHLILFFIAMMLSSAAAAVADSISFIGLMGPYIARRIVGPRHQLFLPIAVLVGTCLFAIADTVGKIVLQPDGVSAGIVVTIIGAPYFLYLTYKTKNV